LKGRRGDLKADFQQWGINAQKILRIHDSNIYDAKITKVFEMNRERRSSCSSDVIFLKAFDGKPDFVTLPFNFCHVSRLKSSFYHVRKKIYLIKEMKFSSRYQKLLTLSQCLTISSPKIRKLNDRIRNEKSYQIYFREN
jgi:hypothetical protein